MKGQKINDRYQIIKSIGEGGMANVYLAYDTILDRTKLLLIIKQVAYEENFYSIFKATGSRSVNI